MFKGSPQLNTAQDRMSVTSTAVRLVALSLCALAMFLPERLLATDTIWTIDDSKSTVSMRFAGENIVLSGQPMTLQFVNQSGTGSQWNVGNIAPLTGWLFANYDTNQQTFRFTNGSSLNSVDSGAYRPDYITLGEQERLVQQDLNYSNTGAAPAVFGGAIRATQLGVPITLAYYSVDAAKFTLNSGTLVVSQNSSGLPQANLNGVQAAVPVWSGNIDGISSLFGTVFADVNQVNRPGNLAGSSAGTAVFSQTNLRSGYDMRADISVSLSGQLALDGLPVFASATLTLVAYANVNGIGNNQQNPVLPDQVTAPGDPKSFTGIASNQWADPPAAAGFAYTMQSNSLFTGITGLPTGYTSPFTVSVDGISLGTFTSADQVDFSNYAAQLGSLLVNGRGVRDFRITGISPDPETDSTAFPIRLAFDTPSASYTATALPVPEPSSLMLAVLAVVGGFVLWIVRKSKCRFAVSASKENAVTLR